MFLDIFATLFPSLKFRAHSTLSHVSLICDGLFRAAGFVSTSPQYVLFSAQKTSGSIQQPNDKLPAEDFEADVELRNAAEIAGVLGDKFDHLCSGRGSAVYAREADLLASAEGRMPMILFVNKKNRVFLTWITASFW